MIYDFKPTKAKAKKWNSNMKTPDARKNQVREITDSQDKKAKEMKAPATEKGFDKNINPEAKKTAPEKEQLPKESK